MAYYDTVILLIKAIVIGIVILGLIGFILRPLIKGLTSKVDSEPSRLKRIPGDQFNEEEIEIPTTQDQEPDSRSIIKMAKDDPIRTTMLVRNWLRDKK